MARIASDAVLFADTVVRSWVTPSGRHRTGVGQRGADSSGLPVVGDGERDVALLGSWAYRMMRPTPTQGLGRVAGRCEEQDGDVIELVDVVDEVIEHAVRQPRRCGLNGLRRETWDSAV